MPLNPAGTLCSESALKLLYHIASLNWSNTICGWRSCVLIESPGTMDDRVKLFLGCWYFRPRMNFELHNLVWQKKKSIFSYRSRGHNLSNWGVIYKWSVWEQLICFELRLAFASGFVLHDYTVAHQATTDDCTWHEPIHSDRREDHFHIFHKSNKKVL